jgi:signal peptidase II
MVILCDQAAKAAVTEAIAPGDSVTVLPGIELAPTTNRGIAFGLLGGGGNLVLVITIVALVVLVAYFARHLDRPGLWVPVGLLVGGALGNLADRAREGAVIDFIDLPRWPAFNVADIAITAGIVLLLIAMVRSDGEPP